MYPPKEKFYFGILIGYDLITSVCGPREVELELIAPTRSIESDQKFKF